MPEGSRAAFDREIEQYTHTARAVRREQRGSQARDWALYTAAAGSALGMASAAEAAIIYSGVQNITFTRGTGMNSVQTTNVDLDSTAPDEFLMLLAFFSNGTSAGAGAGLNDGINADFVMNANNSGPQRLSSGATIGTSQPFGGASILRYASLGGTIAGTWPGGNPAATTGFAGIAFTNGGTTHFGWLRLRLRNDANGLPDQLTLVDWAYQTTDNASIQAGQVPEPSSLALLAAGATGLAAWRRRARSRH